MRENIRSNRKHSTSLRRVGTIAVLFFLFLGFSSIEGASIDELRSRIEAGNQKIDELTREIESLSRELNLTTKQSQTLSNRLKELDLTKKKLAADIALTNRRIASTGLNIEELTQSIREAESSIATSSAIIAETIRLISARENESVIENLLDNKTVSGAWDYVVALSSVGADMRLRLIDLREEREDLAKKKELLLEQKKVLEKQQKNLADQRKVAEYNATETSKLLSSTKNREKEYEQQLAEKKAERDAFEAELYAYESQLQIAIDPSSIPSEKKGVLKWPLDSIYITQYFGKTSSSRRLYVSGTHNGIDFRAPVGTPVKASLSGIVQATGDTDRERGCYSYGKWILIRHANGLSTLYAHLSVISVDAGDVVVTGDRIGYSGNTGYSTGPHLHLSVFASQGVRVGTFGSSRNCRQTTLPLADVKAYLDPSAYLPKP